MKIQTFKNMRGLIHGADPTRMGCDRGGILKIGNTEIPISKDEDPIVPLLFGGLSGDYRATFTDSGGNIYELDKVAVRGGRIAPPPSTTVELMELRYRVDELEDKVEFLGKIFDTNSLNFLIK
jgi:hypothetical protein